MAHTLHVAGFAGAHWERRLNVTTNVATVTNYLSFGGETVALVTETSTSPGVITTLWQLKDHLGSTTTLLDASGLLSGTRKSYDVWGKRRHVTGEDDTTNSIVSASSRDFTGHEFLEELRLVHMGGRIYDPVVARFLSPDPFVQDPFNLQNLNRYSYVLNNPLAYTDPDGFFFKSISRAFGKLQRFFQRTPIAALAVGIGVAALTGVWLDFNLFTIQGAVIAGSVSGALTDGLRGAIFGAVSGAVTFGIGELGLGFLGDAAFLGKAGLHGVAQGALAEARGGEFGPAFLAASFAHAAGSGLADIDALKGNGFEKVVARTAAAAVIGGTASIIGGGKFQNGAATGAFVHLFNTAAHLARAAQLAAGLGVGAGERGLLAGIASGLGRLLAGAWSAVIDQLDIGRSVALFRAVGSAELESIMATNGFSFPPNGSEMKQFWLNVRDAENFSAEMNRLLQNNEYQAIVGTRVTRQTFSLGTPGTDPLAGQLRPYVTYDMNTLPNVNNDAQRFGIQRIR